MLKTKNTIKYWKKKAWDEFSLYIRRLYADRNGFVKCYTCGTVKHYKEMQAGHFVDGRGTMVLFDERLVFPQCYICNCMKHGDKVNYTLKMLEKYSKEEIQDFENLKGKTKPMKWFDYQEIYEKYHELISSL